MRRVWHRIYSDFLMRPRLTEYRALLEAALNQGYEVHSVLSFWQESRRGLDPSRRYLINRHDVDTDVNTALQMHWIEQDLGVKASYYFRLSTLCVQAMQDIERSGSEASYHFEEIATICKQKGLGTRQEVEQHMPEIRALFRTNFTYVRTRTGLPMLTVASHGDFVNRHLQVANHELLDDGLRQELGIVVEAYDEALTSLFTERFTDTLYPRFWRTYSPLVAIERGDPVIHILTHPRHWQSAPLVNLADDLRRLREGVTYQVRAAMRKGA